MKKNLIFLDDERNFEDVTWIDYPEYKHLYVFRTMQEFVFIVQRISDLHNYDFSFDHDLQDFSHGVESTGYDCVKWLCDYVTEENKDLSKSNFYYHTQNPIGRENMKSYIDNFLKFQENHNEI